MKLEAFELDQPAAQSWLEGGQPDRPGQPGRAGWDPLEVGAEREVIELLTSAQRHGLLTGPAELALIYIEDPDGDVYNVVIDLKVVDGGTLRLASAACNRDVIALGRQTGIQAALAILEGITAEANTLVHQLEGFAAPHEQAAIDQAMQDLLDVTDGIQAHETCGCGEPIALYEDRWCHVYNDVLRGTDDHDPEPG